ncbi:MAG: hypothetical protein Q7T61_00890 [Caulobacter sp.]|nr:hypothetical protein [Caulobacter sp.]
MVVAAVVAGVVAVGSAVAKSEAADSASDRVSAANKKARNVQAQIRAENKEILDPFIQRGNKAGEVINSFLGLNGSQAGQEAFNTWLQSSDYQFTNDRGMNAITGNAATRGMLNSGSTLKALQKFGQGNAQQYAGNWLSALNNQQSTGLSAGNALAGYNAGYANNVAANYQNTGAAQANAELIRGQATADALQSIGSIFSFGAGGGGGSSMAGMFGSSNFGASSFMPKSTGG